MHFGIANIVFLLILGGAVFYFTQSIRRIAGTIQLGQPLDIKDHKRERWGIMARVAMGQSKMVVKPVAGFFHLIIYVGFVLINIEVIEIITDGIFGTHRVLKFLGPLYTFMIGFFEILAFATLIAAIAFLIRRNLLKVQRFHKPEMKGWPYLDANLILVFEVVLMAAILLMNASDYKLQQLGAEHYPIAGSFPVSRYLLGFLPDQIPSLILVERAAWWVHIVGILFFLNYVPFSKHFHIFLSFPNTWYSKLKPAGELDNLASVTNEVKLMLDPNADPFAAPPPDESAMPVKFGAEDITDLTWKNLMDAYSCTECGRCTAACPANATGKKLSPRKIMMDVRDRADDLWNYQKENGQDQQDGKKLLGDYITEEELWACNTCNACTEACPVLIDPLQIIVDLRRHLVMEQSKVPGELATTFTNMENNGAPWQFSPSDRLNWKDE
jgi:heterodisulfide reductase subunit C